jgi:hypothetical protein
VKLYLDDHDFGAIYDTCKVSAKDKYFRHDGFLFKGNKLCVRVIVLYVNCL